jgi:NitT/TauT family transport system substrate-binding protein
VNTIIKGGLPIPQTQTRRRFLTGLSLAGAASLIRVPPGLAAEGALETTTVRLSKNAGICPAPLYVAEELLRAEGFTEIRYLEMVPGEASTLALARGNIDLGLNFAVPLITVIDAGAPVTVLAGGMSAVTSCSPNRIFAALPS